MASELSKLLPQDSFHLETQSLGTIWCDSLKVGTLSMLEKELKQDDIDSVIFARKLLHEVGRHKEKSESEQKDEDATKSAPFSVEDISRLSDEEIEHFSSEFVAHNDWLLETYETTQRSVTTNDEGDKVPTIHRTPIELPKDDAERDSDYLVRLLRRYIDEQAKQINQMLRSFSGSLFKNTFSTATKDLLKKHVSLSDQLRRTLQGFGPSLTGPHIADIVKSDYTGIEIPTLPENPIHETNQRLNDVLDHAEELRPIFIQSAELFRNMSDTAVQMHADFNRSAGKSLFVSVLVGCIAGASLVVTALYSWWSYEQSSLQETQYQRNLREQRAQIQTLVEQQDSQYRQLLDYQGDQLATLIRRQDAQVQQIIESLRADDTNSD